MQKNLTKAQDIRINQLKKQNKGFRDFRKERAVEVGN